MFSFPRLTPYGELEQFMHFQALKVATDPDDDEELEKLVGCWLVAPHWTSH